MNKHTVGITIGDFNGIGPELILRTLTNPLVFNYCIPVVYASPFVLKFYARLLDLSYPDISIVNKKEDIKEGVINLRVSSDARIDITPGEATQHSGEFALAALKMAVNDVKEGWIDNILTAPIDKKVTKDAGLDFNGHTEFFASSFDSEAQMILLNDSIKVAMVTGHTPIQHVSTNIDKEKIVKALIKLQHTLTFDFGIPDPKIAVLGLNPHLGDKGVMGSQELDCIEPAIIEAQSLGVLAIGPYSPDGFFGSQQYKTFDAILGMYHDQVLIPFKQLAFTDGVNFTAGLPIIRTSPDHGTAFDIAGKGIADLSSFVNALYLINKVYRTRLENFKSQDSFLAFKEHRREKFSIGVPDLN